MGITWQQLSSVSKSPTQHLLSTFAHPPKQLSQVHVKLSSKAKSKKSKRAARPRLSGAAINSSQNQQKAICHWGSLQGLPIAHFGSFAQKAASE